MDINMRIKVAGRDDVSAKSDASKPAASFAKELKNALRLEGRWELYDAVGRALDPAKSLEDNGVVDGHVLDLRNVDGVPPEAPPASTKPRPGTGLRLDVTTPHGARVTTEAEPGVTVRELVDQLAKSLKLEGRLVLHDENQGGRRLDPKKTLQQNGVRDRHHVKLVPAPPPWWEALLKHRRAVAVGAALLLVFVVAVVFARRKRPHPPPRIPVGMVHVPGGSFVMGSSDEEITTTLQWCRTANLVCVPEVLAREKPARPVTVSSFLLDATEVTNEQFKTWLEKQPHTVSGDRVFDGEKRLLLHLGGPLSGILYASSQFTIRDGFARRPVVQVTWFAADQYCRSNHKRLPTEAQWEFAARGTDRRRFPWGERAPNCGEVVFGRHLGLPGNQKAACPGNGPEVVGTAPLDVTPERIHDLAGNVAEWVEDGFDPAHSTYPNCAPNCLDPKVPPGNAPFRVIRGGDWAEGADVGRGAGRSRRPPGDANVNVGFRCAADLPPRGR